MSSSSAASSPSPSPSSVDSPGSRTVWFGKSHLGTRFDALDEGFKAWCLHPLRKRNRWYSEFAQLNEDYKRWQEENGCATPPGNVIVWFGRLKGHTFRDIYNRPQYIRWLMSDENESRPWYYRVRELYDLYKLHLESHRRPHRSRRPTEHIRDLGDKVGWRDDNVPDQEDYELDGFVVADEDLEGDDYSEDEDEEGEDEEDEARETGEDDSQRSTALDEETGTQETTSSSSSSDAENASRTPPRTRSFTSHLKNDTDAQSTEPSETPSRKHQSLGSDSEENTSSETDTPRTPAHTRADSLHEYTLARSKRKTLSASRSSAVKSPRSPGTPTRKSTRRRSSPHTDDNLALGSPAYHSPEATALDCSTHSSQQTVSEVDSDDLPLDQLARKLATSKGSVAAREAETLTSPKRRLLRRLPSDSECLEPSGKRRRAVLGSDEDDV